MKTLVINFKTYKEATGSNAIKLARICKDVSDKNPNLELIICPQFTGLKDVSNLGVKTFAQHIDSLEPGRNTGSVTPFSVREAGAIGTLISHSEKRLPLEEIARCVKIAKKYGLATLVCSDSLERTREIVKLNPDYIAYEDPGLIGTGTPISKAMPDDVKKFVEIVSKANSRVIPLCGAGISSGEDFRSALELGTKGVILASAFVKSPDPKKFLEDMIKAIF